MKVSAVVAPLLLSAAALTDAFSIHRGSKQDALVTIQDDALKVPGDSPLEHCSAGFEEHDILILESVDLSPNPPLAYVLPPACLLRLIKHLTDPQHSGQTLSIKATGTLKQDVAAGAYANIIVKYGVITLLRTTIDLCEEIQKVDLKCPLKAGEMTLTKDVELPNKIPPVSAPLVWGRTADRRY